MEDESRGTRHTADAHAINDSHAHVNDVVVAIDLGPLGRDVVILKDATTVVVEAWR